MEQQFKKLADFKTLFEQKGQKKRLVLAVAQDKNSLAAVLEASKANIVTPILIGRKSLIEQFIQMNNLNFDDVQIIDEENAEKSVELAVKMVHNKEADFIMKGKVPTPVLLKAVLNREWGLRTGNLLSHLAIFEIPAYHKLLSVTDVAMNIAPNLQDKISILNNSVKYLNTIGISLPKVAVLGAIEMVNESMQATLDAALLSKMNQREQIKNCIVDGPLAFDNAISFESARHKGIKSEVAGDTDLLLMPDIEVGNVLYKSLVFFGQTKVASIILGASAPIVLTSRSDSEESKFYSILLAALA